MKVADVCKEFFTGFKDLHVSFQNDDSKSFVSGALKVCAYCTCIIPAIVALTYGADVLIRHYHLDQQAADMGRKVSSAACSVFQQAGKTIEEKSGALRREAFVFAKARYEDIIHFKDELVGNRNSPRNSRTLEERAADWVAQYGADYQNERLAYILEVLESPQYQTNKREYVRQWMDRRGPLDFFRHVEDVALRFFKNEHGIR